MKILIHSCCAPCSSGVCFLLQDKFQITLFYYNPNIYPESEYQRRLEELEKYSEIEKIRLIIGSYDYEEWNHFVQDYSEMPEGSLRCKKCYEFRLVKTFSVAAEESFDLVASTLSISPYKNAEWINEIGNKLSKESGIGYLESDFKKEGGFSKSVQLSKEYGFYRQKYCGCIFSRNETEKRRKKTPV